MGNPSILSTPFNKKVMWGFGLGAVAGIVVTAIFPHNPIAPLEWRAPLPHQIAPFEGGVSLRFAMVHDVIHERFPAHGKDYYQHRNDEVRAELVKQRMAAPLGQTQRRWGLMDDLAVGHVHLAEFDQAIAVMQEKLSLQESLGITGRELYSTYANLGTAQMIQSLGGLFTGKPEAIEQLQESLVWIKKSIEVNPQAHFGREKWQVALGEFLLAAQNRPHLLGEYDMVGNELGGPRGMYAYGKMSTQSRSSEMPPFYLTDPDAHMDNEMRERWRNAIAELRPQTYSEQDSSDEAAQQKYPFVPFDEPTLAIIGMWRYGAGANAHFALCLGETMLRVGQHYIAWDAFERAAGLADGFCPDPKVREQFMAHCRARQKQIEAMIPENTPVKLLEAFEQDLKHGVDYQSAMQAYESQKLAAGARTDEPTFYDAFNVSHPPIASPLGDADEVMVRAGSYFAYTPLAILGGGMGAFGMAIRERRKRDASSPAQIATSSTA